MSPPKIEVTGVRVERADDSRLAAFFDTIEETALETLEKAARELVQLITAFYTVVLGLLALGTEQVAPLLRSPIVLGAGGATLLAFFIALLAALDVILPAVYRVREASLSDRSEAYRKMLQRKSSGLRAAAIAFGLGMAALLVLIGAMLYARWV